MRIYIVCWINLILFAGCVDDITLEALHEPLDEVVINGRLIYGPVPEVLVRVEAFTPKTFFGASEPIMASSVRLIDAESGATLDIPVDVSQRGYGTKIPVGDPRFSIETGTGYILEVELPDGRAYQSAIDTLYEGTPISSINYELDEKVALTKDGESITEPIIRYSVVAELNRPDGRGKARYRFRRKSIFKLTETTDNMVFGHICYLSAEPDRSTTLLLDGTQSSNEEQDVISLDILEDPLDFRYAEGYQMTVIQETLSEEAHRYWEQFDRIINRSGTIAEDPVGQLRGNMHSMQDPEEVVFGLFYATHLDTIQQFVTPREVGMPKTFCPLPENTNPNPYGVLIITLCDDCVYAWGAENSSYSKPPNWGG